MKLYVTCCAWGVRKAVDGVGGIFVLDFDNRQVVQRQDFPICPGAFRSFNGLTYDAARVYAARPLGDHTDEIVVFDRASLKPILHVQIPDCYDIHQIDLFDDLLWLTNTNYHQVVVVDPRGWNVVGRHTVFPNIPEERKLTESNRRVKGDYRMRPHINAIMVMQGKVQLGLFGVGQGDFQQSQLLELAWEKDAKGQVHFSTPRPLPVQGFRYPHNVHLRPDGTVLGCGSADGEFRCGDRTLKFDGWPRGIAVTATEYFVALSSYSYGLSADPLKPRPESKAAVVRIDRATLTVKDRYDFERIGQLFEVRLAEGTDYGMSRYYPLDPRGAHGPRRKSA